MALEKHPSSSDDDYGYYRLPQHVYNAPSLTILSLSGCDVGSTELIGWASLKSLSIKNMKWLGDGWIQNIIRGSPLLESLELCQIGGYLRDWSICSERLVKLVIEDCLYSFDDNDSNLISVYTPKLHYLRIHGIEGGMKFRLMNVESLVECEVEFHLTYDYCSESDRNLFKKLLCSLCHVQKLTVGKWCTQVLAYILQLEGTTDPLLSKCKYLAFDWCIERCDLNGIAAVLRHLPSLDTFVINMVPQLSLQDSSNENDYGRSWESQKERVKCSLSNLKTVKIVDFVKENCGFQLVQFLLDKARMLEKMVIDAHKFDHGLSFRTMGKEILDLPRSSLQAVIKFT